MPFRTVNLHKHVLALLALGLLLWAGAAWARQWDPAYEDKIGREALEEVKKQYTVYEDAEQHKSVMAIIDDLKAVSQRPDVNYQVFLLDTEEENAFSLPGGYICLTKALLTNVQSVHELAGVLAHEMAHNCTYDALEEAEKAQKVTMPVMAAVIAAMVTGRGTEAVANTFMAGMYVAHGILSTYSIKVEAQADKNGVDYLIKSGKYNPVGLLTFMERLAAKERSRPPVTLGIFQTHPFSVERVTAITDQIRAAGLEINRRAVTKWDPPQVEAGQVGEQPAQVLSLWGQPLFAFNWAPPGTEVSARGAEMVKALTEVLAAGAESWEFYVDTQDGPIRVKARDRVILTVYPEDAQLNDTDVPTLANRTLRNIGAALFAERLNRLYQ